MTRDLPSRIGLNLLSAIMGWSRLDCYRWSCKHPSLAFKAPGEPAAVSLETLEELLGRPVTPLDLTRGMAALERRRDAQPRRKVGEPHGARA